METTKARPSKEEDKALRPRSFAEYRGQDEVRQNLQVYVAGALDRGEPLDHVLVSGPAGLGKTTLAEILANEMRAKLVSLLGPSVKTKGELFSVLTGLSKGDVLFIDEIHALHPKIAEILYTAMEDGEVSVVVAGNAIVMKLEPFTLVGATTNSGRLLKPLRERFGIKAVLTPYDVPTLTGIVRRSAAKLGLACDPEGAVEIARRSRGTPRLANAMLRRVRDFAHAAGGGATAAVVSLACERLGVDAAGLDQLSRRYLKVLADRGAAVALGTMVSLTGESKDAIEDEVEPYLLSIGFVEKTPKGRVITAEGRRHIGSNGAS